MTRDELRSAITGPVAVGGRRDRAAAGAAAAERHRRRPGSAAGPAARPDAHLGPLAARTAPRARPHRPRGLRGVGTLRQALSLHAEEAFEEIGPGRNRQIAERMFKALTDTFTDPRGVRRPTSVAELAAICEAAEADVIRDRRGLPAAGPVVPDAAGAACRSRAGRSSTCRTRA